MTTTLNSTAMTTQTHSTKRKHFARTLVAAAAALTLSLSACSGGQNLESDMSGDASSAASAQASSTFFTTDRVHAIDVELDTDDYQEMLSTYAATGDKDWLSVTVTIDGTTYKKAGLRLKGNKSLRTALASERGIQLTDAELGDEGDSDSDNADTADPATIPWLIRLDKYVDGQEYLGRTDFVVRGNDTESYLNEAVAVAMLEEAGLPTHRVGFTSFSVNGEDAVLRLVSEVPDDELWNEEWFGTEGSTWKADSDGDWDYHGDNGADYEDIWKQRTGDDMTPVVEFMDFINNSSDEVFAEELPGKLDVEEFATYLATEKLLGNTDTISGPGNNGYLHYEPSTGQMIVVPWDHDMVFGGMGMGGPGGSNVLEQRFLEVSEFSELYQERYQVLREELIESGFALKVLNQYANLLIDEAGDLISAETVESDRASIETYLNSVG